MLDLILKNPRIGEDEKPQDIGISSGMIKTIAPNLEKSTKQVFDIEENFVYSGFYESHIHFYRACILDRPTIEEDKVDEAAEQTSKKRRATANFVVLKAQNAAEANRTIA